MQNQIQKQKREYIQNPFSLFSKYSFGANKRAASKMNKETANEKKTQAVNWFRKEIVCKIREKTNVGQNCKRSNVNFFPFIPRKRDTIEKKGK